MRVLRAAVGILVVLLGAAATPGCATPSTGKPDVSRADRSMLYRAEQILIGQCMRRHGFEYWERPARAVPELRDFPYAIDDPQWAEKYGFGTRLIRRRESIAVSDPNRRYFEGLPAARRATAIRILLGRPGTGDLKGRLPNGILAQRSDKGCLSEAQRNLYGDLKTWYRVLKISENLDGTRVGLVQGDPAYVKATNRWSACMAARGLRYASPAELHSKAFEHSESFERERALARSEVSCAQSSGLRDIARRLDKTYNAKLRKQFAAELRAERRLQIAALPRARALVESTLVARPRRLR